MQKALLARFLRWSPVALHRSEGVFAKRQNTCGKEKQRGNEKKSARPAMNMNIFVSPSTNHKLQMRSSPAIECVLCVSVRQVTMCEGPHQYVDGRRPPAYASNDVMLTSAAGTWLDGCQTRRHGQEWKTE